MTALGYEFLRRSLPLQAFAPRLPAILKPVTRVEPTPTYLAVPSHVAPASDEPLQHILFALKHEGVNLQILAQALPHVPAQALVHELHRTPNGRYIRMACHLWESLTHQTLDATPAIGGSYANLFDPRRYVTGPPQRDARWRINFNGLGTPRYCVTVERTPTIQAAINANVLQRANAFRETLGAGLMERTLAWAYLHETRDSFAIEREAPSEDKSRAFIALLHQAHSKRALTEDYLVELQAATVSNPFDKATAFRTEQNWLGGPARGAAGVTYLPPPPELARELMDELMCLANAAAGKLDPLVAAAVISFGFVYIHPFMDGNGRLSRFLFHQALCQSGQLADGLVLPVSVAMKKHEAEYLRVLQIYSQPAREFWRVTWLDNDNYHFDFLGDAAHSIYRYWDATPCVEFGFAMAEQALNVELRRETRFLARYDAIHAAVNERFDLRGSDLSTLIVGCIENDNGISQRRRDQFSGRVPDTVFTFIEEMAVQTERDCTDAAPSGPP
ncbi:MAG TPA: Fic family protein [Rhodanobacter sp.]|nr:Fic family protein [Rhodanobacter sp.]